MAISFSYYFALRAPVSHLFSLGHPWLICFPWASLALFLTLHYHGLLLIPLGFPSPIILFSSLGFMVLPLISYFLCLHYFEPTVAYSHFSTSYCPWLTISLFLGCFEPLFHFEAHLLILWACDPLFLPLRLNGFSIRLPILFCPCCCCWAFFFLFWLPKWPSTIFYHLCHNTNGLFATIYSLVSSLISMLC